MTDTLRHGKNQDVLHTTAGIAVKGKDGLLLIEERFVITINGTILLKMHCGQMAMIHCQ